MSNDLAVQIESILPQPKVVKAGGEDIVIKPLGISKYPPILKLLKKVMDTKPDTKGFDPKEFFFEFPEETLALMAIAINKPITFFDNVMPDEAMELLMAIAEVNVDFFVTKILPLVESLPARVEGLTKMGKK